MTLGADQRAALTASTVQRVTVIPDQWGWIAGFEHVDQQSGAVSPAFYIVKMRVPGTDVRRRDMPHAGQSRTFGFTDSQGAQRFNGFKGDWRWTRLVQAINICFSC